MAQRAEFVPGGWVVNDLRAYRALTEYEPPRRWGYWDQIVCDVHEPKLVWLWIRTLLFIVAGIAFPIAALCTETWSLALGGLLVTRGGRLLWIWCRLANSVIGSVRNGPVATGVVAAFEPHPMLPNIVWIGSGRRTTGESVNLGVEIPLGQAIEQTGMPAEVLFIDDPASQYRAVFAGRPMRRQSN